MNLPEDQSDQFSAGDAVRVKAGFGFSHPKYPDIPMGGWRGSVGEFDGYDSQYLIFWDKTTLAEITPAYSIRCRRDGKGVDGEDGTDCMYVPMEYLERNVGVQLPIEQPPVHWIVEPFDKFFKDDKVRVKSAVIHRKYPDIPLGGWTGTVKHKGGYPYQYLVRWDECWWEDWTITDVNIKDSTVGCITEVYPHRCERDGEPPEEMWFFEEDLELIGSGVERLDIEEPANFTPRPLSQNEQEDRLRAPFGLTTDYPVPYSKELADRYYAYLAANLTFPFEANYSITELVEDDESEEFSYKGVVRHLHDILDTGEILCEVDRDNGKVDLPELADVFAVADARNEQLIRDYAAWCEGCDDAAE